MTTEHTSPLAALGWDAGWAAAFSAATETPTGDTAMNGLVPARVVAEHRDRYVVADGDGERTAVLAGRFRHAATARDQLPAVGDWGVVTAAGTGGTSVVHQVLPRRTAFVRKVAGDVTAAQVVAANVDVALVATALPTDLSTRRLDRYLTLAWESGATPIVVLTKADLSDDVASAVAEVRAVFPGTPVIAISATTGAGVDDLVTHLLPGHTAVLLGSSGVGKSTLVNRLLGAERLRTSGVREDGRGRHTTTHRELVVLAGGALLIDTPGMRELQLWSAESGLGVVFSDVDALAERCRFRDCAHDGEPDCAVTDAVQRGELAGDRLDHWRQLRRELAYLERKQDELALARSRGETKSLARALRSRLREKYGK